MTHEIGDLPAEDLGQTRPGTRDEEMEKLLDPATDPSFADDEDQ
jgi:hypothetical protein